MCCLGAADFSLAGVPLTTRTGSNLQTPSGWGVLTLRPLRPKSRSKSCSAKINQALKIFSMTKIAELFSPHNFFGPPPLLGQVSNKVRKVKYPSWRVVKNFYYPPGWVLPLVDHFLTRNLRESKSLTTHQDGVLKV